jgi:hypothetical protein
LAYQSWYLNEGSRRKRQLVELLGMAVLVLGSKQLWGVALGVLHKGRLGLGVSVGMQVQHGGLGR